MAATGSIDESAAQQELTHEVVDDLKPRERRWWRIGIEALHQAKVPFLMAGAFGLYHHTGFWRGTKDMDVLVLPEHREQAVKAITGAGYFDLFDQDPYDREWIFRGTREGVIFDVIWQLANKEDNIDQCWFERAAEAEFMGLPCPVVGAADMCWMKLFVFQRKRCDWPDIINIIRGTEGKLDWDHLLREVGSHWRLLAALIELYDWVCPTDRPFIPREFRDQIEDLRRRNADSTHECRHDLFDSRPWLTDPGAGHSTE